MKTIRPVSKSARIQCYIKEQSISIRGTSLSERMSRATRLKWNKLNRKRMLRTCSPKGLSGSSSTLSVESWDVELRGCVGSHANEGFARSGGVVGSHAYAGGAKGGEVNT